MSRIPGKRLSHRYGRRLYNTFKRILSLINNTSSLPAETQESRFDMYTTLATHDRVCDNRDISTSNNDKPSPTNPDLTTSRSLNRTDPQQETVQPFRFFDLPAEIRSMTLGHALEFEGPLRQYSPNFGRRQFLIDIRLLTTNHQMYKEASPIFHGLNRFNFFLYLIDYDGLPNWVAYPEQFTRHLRRFRIILDTCWIRWSQKNHEIMDKVTRTLALCQRLELVEILFVVQSAYRCYIDYPETFKKPTSASIKGLLSQLSGIPGKRAIYVREIEKYQQESNEQPASFWNNLTLSAETVHIDRLSVE